MKWTFEKLMESRERFWSFIQVGNRDECWPWIGYINVYGYGIIGINRHPVKAHRAMFWLNNPWEPLPEVVRHSCDNPLCVNPAHLLGGTHRDNVADRVSRVRTRTGHKYGVEHPGAKLNPDLVRYIRSSTKSGPVLAKELGVDHTTIYNVKKFKVWKAIV
jgi:hypothetical protein